MQFSGRLYLSYLRKKDHSELTGVDSYVINCVKVNNRRWLPNKTSWALQNLASQEEDETDIVGVVEKLKKNEWGYLNNAVSLKAAVTDKSIEGRSFPLSRIRAYSGTANQARADNWQPLAIAVIGSGSRRDQRSLSAPGGHITTCPAISALGVSATMRSSPRSTPSSW